jgi:hypothetical protein
MADKKISALTGATTPLAGTEVLPIVQSGATVKVATDDLTVRNIRANATTGILQVTGPAAASTRVMTVPDANFTAARTDAAQSFTGDQTLSTGNLVIGTSGKGIDFSDTPGTGTSELIADYEEGTWTPVVYSGGTDATMNGVTSGIYTKIGRVVHLHMWVQTTTLNGIGGGQIALKGLPFTVNSGYAGYAGATAGYSGNLSITAGQSVALRPNAGGTTMGLLVWTATTGTTTMTGTEWTDTGFVSVSLSYFV